MTFHVGQKVVCVDDDWEHPMLHLCQQLPRKGDIYQIRAINAANLGDACPLYFRFNEIHNPSIDGYAEPDFGSLNFRPVVTRKTDISIFTKMLTPKVHELEDVRI